MSHPTKHPSRSRSPSLSIQKRPLPQRSWPAPFRTIKRPSSLAVVPMGKGFSKRPTRSKITSGSNNWQDKTSYVRNNYQNSLSNYPKLTKTGSGTYTLSKDTPDVIKTGGINLNNGENNIAIHPNRIWTPFKNMNNLTIQQNYTYSIGPFGLNDSIVLGQISSPTRFKIKIQ